MDEREDERLTHAFIGHGRTSLLLAAALVPLLGCYRAAIVRNVAQVSQPITSPPRAMAAPGSSKEHQVLAEWLAAFNSNDLEAFEKFAAARYSPQELAERDAATITAGARNWFLNYGKMRPSRISSKSGEAEAIVHLGAVDACARLWVESNANKIGGVYLEPFAPVQCGERETAVTDMRALGRALRAYVARLANGGQFSGVVLVKHKERPIVAVAHGIARMATGEKNRLDTRFELASNAKMFTAVAVALLVERGQLSYDSRLGDVLPNYPGVAGSRSVNMRQLLSHTSGLVDYYRNGEIFKDYRQRTSLADYWPLFASYPLEFKPGSRYSYSNSNYVLLGSVVENVSKQPFTSFVQQQIFTKAAMRSSCYCTPGVRASAQPRTMHTALAGPARRPLREGWIEVPDDWPRPAAPAGSGMSTAHDLGLFGSSLINGGIISSAVRDQMFAPVIAMDDGGEATSGFQAYRVGVERVIGHGGFSWGVRTQTDLYPKSDLVVVILSNTETSGTEAIKYKSRKWIASFR